MGSFGNISALRCCLIANVREQELSSVETISFRRCDKIVYSENGGVGMWDKNISLFHVTRAGRVSRLVGLLVANGHTGYVSGDMSFLVGFIETLTNVKVYFTLLVGALKRFEIILCMRYHFL